MEINSKRYKGKSCYESSNALNIQETLSSKNVFHKENICDYSKLANRENAKIIHNELEELERKMNLLEQKINRKPSETPVLKLVQRKSITRQKSDADESLICKNLPNPIKPLKSIQPYNAPQPYFDKCQNKHLRCYKSSIPLQNYENDNICAEEKSALPNYNSDTNNEVLMKLTDKLEEERENNVMLKKLIDDLRQRRKTLQTTCEYKMAELEELQKNFEISDRLRREQEELINSIKKSQRKVKGYSKQPSKCSSPNPGSYYKSKKKISAGQNKKNLK